MIISLHDQQSILTAVSIEWQRPYSLNSLKNNDIRRHPILDITDSILKQYLDFRVMSSVKEIEIPVLCYGDWYFDDTSNAKVENDIKSYSKNFKSKITYDFIKENLPLFDAYEIEYLSYNVLLNQKIVKDIWNQYKELL
jgi:hypothetical protein